MTWLRDLDHIAILLAGWTLVSFVVGAGFMLLFLRLEEKDANRARILPQ